MNKLSLYTIFLSAVLSLPGCIGVDTSVESRFEHDTKEAFFIYHEPGADTIMLIKHQISETERENLKARKEKIRDLYELGYYSTEDYETNTHKIDSEMGVSDTVFINPNQHNISIFQAKEICSNFVDTGNYPDLVIN